MNIPEKSKSLSYEGKVVAITGASSGIGRALAIALAEKGATLALSDINPDELLKTSTLIGNKAAVHLTTLNISDRVAVHKWADDVVTHYGRVDIIINNAGMYLKGYIEESSYEEIQEIVGVNLLGVIYGTKAFLPYLRSFGGGHIVNVSSLYGLISMPTSGFYCSTKFAVRGFTESLQQELELKQSNVFATCVYPGGIRTNIMRNARIAKNSQFYDDSNVLNKAEKYLKVTPERAASIIINAILKKKKRVLIGNSANILDYIQRLFPCGYQKVVKLLYKGAKN